MLCIFFEQTTHTTDEMDEDIEVIKPLQWFVSKTLSRGCLTFFPSGSYARIGTNCVESEINYEKYKKIFFYEQMLCSSPIHRWKYTTPWHPNVFKWL